MAPQKRPKVLTVRLTDSGLAALQAKAEEWGMPQSQVVRLMLSYAAVNMPPPRKRPKDDPFN